MLFSSMTFLWVFLPLCLIGYYLLNQRYRNIFLLIASLIFYAWGEPKYIIVMLLSIVINYVLGIAVSFYCKYKKIILFVGILINLAFLCYFKYWNFLGENINQILGGHLTAKTVTLPIGISFYTFQSLSYVIDVYRKGVSAQKNILNLGLYVSFFPQLIAGPIVRYCDIEKQIKERKVAFSDFAYGIKRFVVGLSKKVIISNIMAGVADSIFSLNYSDLNTWSAWLGLICYTFQIYYDFSGYSDMAIGLGRMFGFRFSENFNYPYLSKSVKEFWRRWHISLTTWFREYLYIPLGGNRNGKTKTYINQLIVFFATGLWHGASWNFVIWGLYHGLFMTVEKMGFENVLDKNPKKLLNHIYTIMIVMIGWVFFRTNTIKHAFSYLSTLFIYQNGYNTDIKMFLNPEVLLVLSVAIIFSGIIQTKVIFFKNLKIEHSSITIKEIILIILLLLLSITYLANNVYNPFIYFRF